MKKCSCLEKSQLWHIWYRNQTLETGITAEIIALRITFARAFITGQRLVPVSAGAATAHLHPFGEGTNNHDAWTRAYADEDMWNWLFSQHR
jgi:predicted peptidase